MAGLSSLVSQFKRRQTGIFVLGDLNVNYRRDRVVRDRLFPFVNMGAVDVEASYEHLGMPRTGTHERRDGGTDTRLIDYVYFMPRLPLTPRSQTVLSGYNTDHRPLSVGFTLRGPGSGARAGAHPAPASPTGAGVIRCAGSGAGPRPSC